MIRELLFSLKDDLSPALLDGEKEISRAEIFLQASGVAAAVQGETAPVAFLNDDRTFPAALLGVFASGAAALPLGGKLTRPELTALIDKAKASVLVTCRAYLSKAEDAAAAASLPVRVLTIENLGYQSVTKAPNPDPTLMLIATSGTTGNVKLVKLSESNVETSLNGYIGKMDYLKHAGTEIRYLLGTPCCSAYGVMVTLVCMKMRFPLAILPPAFTIQTLLNTARICRTTHFEGGAAAAQVLERFSARIKRTGLGSMRYFGFAGSTVTEATLRNLAEAFPAAEFWPGYGMTEAGPLIAKPDKIVRPDKLAAVGTAFDGETIRIATEKGLTDEPYIRGEIVVNGPNVTSGYLDNDEETRKLLRGGRLYTGDIGYLDEEGFLYLCGRKKNLVIVRGFNVHPEEVEACLTDSGLVSDCIVYGKQDSEQNERVCADVVPARPDVNQKTIYEYCLSRLAAYKCPTEINLCARIEKTATGKNVKRN